MYSAYEIFAETFAINVTDWDKLEGYVTDAIIRDATGRFTEFKEYWKNCAITDGTTAEYAYVTAYIETVTSHYPSISPKEVMWADWGKLLRELEISK